MSVMDAIKGRKSIRKYADKPIENEKLIKVLEAGRLAPSARNEQNWKFVVVRDNSLRHNLVDACMGQKFVEEAPVTLVICTNNERNMSCNQPARTIDCSIALSFMMLQASELGLSTCWLGSFSNDKVKEVLNIPKEYNVVAVTPLGYAAEDVSFRPRKDMKDVVIYDCWQ